MFEDQASARNASATVAHGQNQNQGKAEDIFADKNQTTAQEKMEEREIKQAVNQALDQLSIKYRSTLTLFYIEDKSYEEISDILKIPTNTVGTRISRGKKLLAYIYQQQEQL